MPIQKSGIDSVGNLVEGLLKVPKLEFDEGERESREPHAGDEALREANRLAALLAANSVVAHWFKP